MPSLVKLGSRQHRSPARDELARVINEKTGVGRIAYDAQASVSRAESLRDQCRERLDQAMAAAAEARDAHAEAMIRAAATGEGLAVGSIVRELQHAEGDARADLEAAERAVETLVARNEEPQRRAREAAQRVRESASVVIAEMAHTALDEADRALAALSRARLTCIAIREHVGPDHPAHFRLRSTTFFDYPGLAADRAAIEAQWHEALAALTANADAALPSIAFLPAPSNERGAA